jgi:hypothetical protein
MGFLNQGFDELPALFHLAGAIPRNPRDDLPVVIYGLIIIFEEIRDVLNQLSIAVNFKGLALRG